MGSHTLREGEGRVLLQDIMDNALYASRIGSPHAMQSLIYKGIYHLRAENRVCQRCLTPYECVHCCNDLHDQAGMARREDEGLAGKQQHRMSQAVAAVCRSSAWAQGS